MLLQLAQHTSSVRACTTVGLYHTPSCSRRRRHVSAAAAAASDAAAVSSTAIVRRQQQLQFQDLLLGDMPQPPQQPLHEMNSSNSSSSSSSSSKKSRAAGFGTQQQATQRVGVKPGDSCPCKSGLQYQACCQPFLSGQVHPRSGPELARARITAALTGDVDYLVASTHPDSSLSLGGSRDLVRRTRSQAAAFQKSKPAVIGMAHCRADVEGQWLALAILQATAGELKGTKEPALYVLAKRGSSSSSTSSTSSSSIKRQPSADDWLYMGQTTKLPQHADADPLWQLLSLHVPEVLLDPDGSSSSGGSSDSSSIQNRELYFLWGTPALGLPPAPEAAVHSAAAAVAAGGGNGGSSSVGRWYLDLLQPAVEPLRAGTSSGSSSSGASRAGVVCMDSFIEARKIQSVQRDA